MQSEVGMRSFINIYPLVITIPFAFALHAETAQCFSSCPSLHLRESERGHKLFLSSELSPEPSVGGGIFARTYGAYGKQLKEKPLRTQSATAGVISLFGDVLSQIVEAKALGVPFALNLARLSGFTIAGTIFSGPFVHLWYEFLWKIGRWQERRYGLGKFLVALTQNAVDQTLGVALFFPAYFYIYEYAEALVGFRGECGQNLPNNVDGRHVIELRVSGVEGTGGQKHMKVACGSTDPFGHVLSREQSLYHVFLSLRSTIPTRNAVVLPLCFVVLANWESKVFFCDTRAD
mmetsp:Transcript_16357/g.47055  ORF Transcript_16357/g.47055 Transcript_16357/m.47055 type:complete len:290 (-) Transcript_16357:494-1363(-)